jgi:hypothetical protein
VALTIKWVQVDDRTRFDAIVNDTADMECGSTTVSLSRMKIVDFPSVVFAESTGVLVKSGRELFSFNGMGGKKIGVIAGTTNARAVRDQLARRNLSATLIEFRDRQEGIAALARGDLDGFASDKLVLLALAQAQGLRDFILLPDDLSFEPFAACRPTRTNSNIEPGKSPGVHTVSLYQENGCSGSPAAVSRRRQSRRTSRQSVDLIVGPSVFDRHVLALDIAGLLQALAKCAEMVHVRVKRCRVEEADHRHRCQRKCRLPCFEILPSRSLPSFAVIAVLFAMVFKWLPDTPIAWRDVWLGAILTAALFEVGKFLIGLYFGKQGLESTYGAATSIVIVLIWVYYTAQLALMGAEFTNVFARRYGSKRHEAGAKRQASSSKSADIGRARAA